MERNWTKPEVTRKIGKRNCAHAVSDRREWYELTKSRMGKAQCKGYLVAHKETRTCAACGHVWTNVLAHTDPEPGEIPADDEDVPIDNVVPLRGKGPVKEFWKGLDVFRSLHESLGGIPYRTPISVVNELIEELHRSTQEHDWSRFTARFAGLAGEVAIEDIQTFIALMRGTKVADETNPVQSELIRTWRLGILPNGESWLLFESPLTDALFEWLGVPKKEFFPESFRDRIDAIPDPKGRSPYQYKSDFAAAEALEQELEKAEEIRRERERETLEHKRRPETFEDVVRAARLETFDVNVQWRESRSEEGPVYLPSVTHEYEIDDAPETLVTGVRLIGRKARIVNLTDGGLTLKIRQTDDEIIFLVCPPRK